MTPELIRYRFNPAVRTASMADSKGAADAMLCTLPGARQQLSLRRTILQLLKLFDGTRTTAEVLDAYREHYGRPNWTVSELERFVEESCLPGRLLLAEADGATGEVAARTPANYLFLRRTVVSPQLVQIAAGPFGWLFSQPFAIAAITLVLLCHALAYWRFGEQIVALARFSQVLAGLTLFAVSVALHELGHAVALVRKGCHDVDIGIGLYLHIPIVYTDASDAWRLSRRERMVIDVAGVYFQQIFATALLLIFFTWRTSCCAYAVALIDGSLLLSLNPFLRMDGYWLLSDLFGIQNLRKQSILATQKFIGLLWPTADSETRELRALTTVQRAVVFTYSAASMMFFAYLPVVLMRYAVHTSIPHLALLPQTLAAIRDSNGIHKAWPAVLALVKSTGELGCLTLCGIFAIRNVWVRITPRRKAEL